MTGYYQGKNPGDIANYLDISPTSGGIMTGKMWWSPSLRGYIRARTQVYGTMSAWVISESLKNYLIYEITLGRPVWVHLASEEHGVVFTGYEENNGTITFHINDPANGIIQRTWENIYNSWNFIHIYTTAVIPSLKVPPPALTVSVLGESVDNNGAQDDGLIFISPMSKKAPFGRGNIRFSWYDPKTTEKGFISHDGSGVGVKAIPKYYSMDLNLRIADMRFSGDQAMRTHTKIANATGNIGLEDQTNFTTLRRGVQNVLIKKDLAITAEGAYQFSADLLDQNSLAVQDVLRIPIQFNKGITLTATLKDQKVALEWKEYPYPEDFGGYQIYRLEPIGNYWKSIGKVPKDTTKSEFSCTDCSESDPYYYAIAVMKGSDVVITSDVVKAGRPATASIGATLNAVTVFTDADGKETKGNPGNYGYTFYPGTHMKGMFTGDVFKGSWSYSDTYDNYWGEMTIKLDDVFQKATEILTFSATDNEEAKDGTKGDTETIGGMGGNFTRTSTSTYDRLTFEVSGSAVCTFVDTTQISYHHFTNNAAGQFTQDDTEFKCNDRSHLFIQIDVMKN